MSQSKHQASQEAQGAPVSLPKDLSTLKPQDLVSIAEAKGKGFAKDMKTHQLRNFFSQVTQMKQQWKMEQSQQTEKPGKEAAESQPLSQKVETQLVMLKPRLAYAAGRQPKSVKPFYDFISQAIDGVLSAQKPTLALHTFFDLIEGVVAYHKFHGGKEN